MLFGHCLIVSLLTPVYEIMAQEPKISFLVKTIIEKRGEVLNISRTRELTLRYVEICHSMLHRNQIHVEFISNLPIELNSESCNKIKSYISNFQLTVYDIHSNSKDRVYVYCFYKRNSPTPIRRPKAVERKSTLEDNPAVEKTSFNGKTLFTPIVFTPQTSTVHEDVQEVEIKPHVPTGEDKPGELASRIQIRPSLKAPCPSFPENLQDYDSVKFLTRSLTNNDNFSRLRRYLAFFVTEKRDLLVETESYLTLKVHLVNEGLPNDDNAMREAYFEFLKSRGFTEQQICSDLDKLRLHLSNSHMIRSNQVKSSFNNYYYGQNTSNTKFIADKPSAFVPKGRCAPDECNLV